LHQKSLTGLQGLANMDTMSVRKENVVELFKKSNRLSQFKTQLLNEGFSFNDKGCNKFVFAHPRRDWVIKLLFGASEQLPNPKSKIAEYFVWPEQTGVTNTWFGDYYELWFQPKVDCRRYQIAYKELMEIFKRERILWNKDNHEWNVGHYKGRPMIFDY
jgi:hypothetical protein